MRKRYRVLMLAALVAGLTVPVGFALSIDNTPVATQFIHVGLLPGSTTPVTVPWTMPDAAKLLGVGTLLFGLAAAVKKST
jgi:drug/metabolite transporter (DMT)-like permease